LAKSDFSFAWPFRVRYSEVDGQKIVFNAHYLTYFDTAVTEYFRALPYDYMGQIDRTGEDFHTVRALVEFKRSIKFDENIEVHVRTSRIGRSSLTFLLEIHPKGADDIRATGEVVWVNVNAATSNAVPLQEELVAKISSLEGERVER
jgi:acyl-CoA thioester hydrolase